ncbi:MAG: amidohydrolase family protein [Pseudomonadota bacterium]
MITAIVNARLLDPATDTDELGGVIIEGGKIAAWGAGVQAAPGAANDIIDAGGLCLAPGLIDLRVKTGEPGEEHRETLETASRAALSGGVTQFVVMPDTKPVIDDVALVQFLTRATPGIHARIHAAGALTTGLGGTAMAEIGLMKEAGAVFFTNGDHTVEDAAVQRRAMAYAASHGAIVASRPDCESLRGSGVMNAGGFAGRLGLKGMAREAEWVGASRDLMLAEATGCKLILDQVSTPRTLDMLTDAKARGAHAGCTVAAHSLFFNELDIGDYLTYCKVNPPFRSEDDRQGLISALASGAIDAVVSAHDPQPPEQKRLPFAEASFGAAGLETTLSAMMSLVHDGPLDLLGALRVLTCGPADLIGLEGGRIAEGQAADLILFAPDRPWKCVRENLLTRSTNSPFDGRLLQGRVQRTLVEGKTVFERQD